MVEIGEPFFSGFADEGRQRRSIDGMIRAGMNIFEDFKIRFQHGEHPFRGDYSTTELRGARDRGTSSDPARGRATFPTGGRLLEPGNRGKAFGRTTYH